MIIVDGLYAVGMHHWGSSRLQVRAAYKLRREPVNRWDSNAIAVYDGSRRVAYLARAYALRLTRVLDVADPTMAIYLKPKEEPEVVSRREGPRQRSTIGFKVRCEKNKIPGYDWFLGLKKRHPDLSLRRPEKLSSCRSKMLNKDVMDKYFSELEKVMNELDLLYKPHLIWNADESRFQMEHKPVNVVASKGVHSVPSKASSSRESVSVLVTCNAAGRTMSPMLVVKGKTRKCLQSWDVESFPDAIWTYQQNAFMEDTLGVEWFTSVFLRECSHERPPLLILDGHHSHQVLGVLEAAKCNDIHIMAIPPHTSHRSQSMDVGVFSALQRMYDRLCSEYMAQSPFHIINNLGRNCLNKHMTRQSHRKTSPVGFVARESTH